ncbi:MAG: hypothetical protein V7784_14805, partial [Oceanospirillaceae bacterium]
LEDIMQTNNETEKKITAKEEISLVSGYDRIIQRISKKGLDTTDSSVTLLKKMVDEAIELEHAAEEMTSDEVHLLAQYVYRDMKLLAAYLHDTGEGLASWLNFDLTILEQSTKQQFMHLADQTIIDNLTLQEKLECSEVQYLAGEICAAGTLKCLNCATEFQLRKTEQITECKQCQSQFFERISKR